MFCHELNRERYTEMLKSLPQGDFRQRIQQLLAETNSRIAEVEAILQTTEPQLPPPARIEAAVQRMEARRAAARIAQGPSS